jgi:hypothetical protein
MQHDPVLEFTAVVYALTCHKVDAVLRVQDLLELDDVRVDTHCMPHL